MDDKVGGNDGPVYYGTRGTEGMSWIEIERLSLDIRVFYGRLDKHILIKEEMVKSTIRMTIFEDILERQTRGHARSHQQDPWVARESETGERPCFSG